MGRRIRINTLNLLLKLGTDDAITEAESFLHSEYQDVLSRLEGHGGNAYQYTEGDFSFISETILAWGQSDDGYLSGIGEEEDFNGKE